MCISLRSLVRTVCLLFAVSVVGNAGSLIIHCYPASCYTPYLQAEGFPWSLHARADDPRYYGVSSASATLSYDATVQIVFHGGTGTGYYAPYVNAYAGVIRPSVAGAGASASFGPIYCSAPGALFGSGCTSYTQTLPFVFDEPQIQVLHMGVSVFATGIPGYSGSAEARASLGIARVFDAQGNSISPTITMTDLVPEPAAWISAALGLVCLVVARVLSHFQRLWTHHHKPAAGQE